MPRFEVTRTWYVDAAAGVEAIEATTGTQHDEIQALPYRDPMRFATSPAKALAEATDRMASALVELGANPAGEQQQSEVIAVAESLVYHAYLLKAALKLARRMAGMGQDVTADVQAILGVNDDRVG